MKIEENRVVGITYELKVSKSGDDSAPFSAEVRDKDDPFYFLYGSSGLPEKFEKLLLDKNEGDKFNFTLEMDEAYGEADDEMIMALPKDQFTSERGFDPDMLEEGNFLPLMDEDGYSMQAKVVKDMGNDLLLDFNHPLVGFNLHFDGEVIEVREASEVEIAHGHVHGEHGEDH